MFWTVEDIRGKPGKRNQKVDMSETIILVGASVRAAARSAQKAGLSTWCCDRFADADLTAMAEVRLLKDGEYPSQLPAILRREAPAGAVVFTGGMENHPLIIEAISLDREILGNPANVLQQVRNPYKVANALSSFGLSVPMVHPEGKALPADRVWLVKPMLGCGGRGIIPWNEQTISVSAAEPSYCQEYIEGVPHAGLFLSDGHRVICLGVCLQLVGLPWLNASQFAYCGSIGPIPFEPEIIDQYRLIGQALVESFGLRGLFGVDTIHQSNRVWMIEVNPRYTASMEVLERVDDRSWLKEHIAVCRGRRISLDDISLRSSRRTMGGKVILFNDAATWPFLGDVVGTMPNEKRVLQLADIPQPGSLMQPHQPICSLLWQQEIIGSVELAIDDIMKRLRRGSRDLYQQWCKLPKKASWSKECLCN